MSENASLWASRSLGKAPSTGATRHSVDCASRRVPLLVGYVGLQVKTVAVPVGALIHPAQSATFHLGPPSHWLRTGAYGRPPPPQVPTSAQALLRNRRQASRLETSRRQWSKQAFAGAQDSWRCRMEHRARRANLRRCRNGPGSSLWSRRPRSPLQISIARRRSHRPRQWPAVAHWNQRSNRLGWLST